MPTLAERLQALPSELYDEIYKLTFSTNKGTVVDLNDQDPFPATLYVDSRSRRAAAVSYFTGASFTFKLADNKDMHFFFRWVASLSDRHFYLISSLVIKMDAPVMEKSSAADFVALQKKWAAEVGFREALQFLGRGLDQLYSAVHIQIWPAWEEGILTESWFAWKERLIQPREQNAGIPAKAEWEYLKATMRGVRV